MTEDERRKQTLVRRHTNKTRMLADHDHDHNDSSVVSPPKKIQNSTTHTCVSTDDDEEEEEDEDEEDHDDDYTTHEGGSSPGRVRDSPSPRGLLAKPQVQNMKSQVALPSLDSETTPSPLPHTMMTSKQPVHSKAILQKKLDKVNKLLEKEKPGSNEYKKLARKQEQYENELNDYIVQEENEMALAQRAKEQQESQRQSAEADARTQQAILAEQQQQEEAMRVAAKAEEARRNADAAAREAKTKESTMAEEARRLKERAEAIKAKRANAMVPQDDSISPAGSPTDSPVVLDDREQRRQQAAEEYRRTQVERKEEEERAKQKAERDKEFKVLKKKLTKLEGMIAEAEVNAKDTAKYLKKMNEYVAQLEEFDEWEEELRLRRQEEDERRLHKEREEAERKRKEKQEAERRRKEEEEAEAERRRKAVEEAERRREAEVRLEAEQLRKRRLEEEESARRERERRNEEERLRREMEREKEEGRRRQEIEREEERMNQERELERQRMRKEREMEEERMKQARDDDERKLQERLEVEKVTRQQREEEENRIRQEREETALALAREREHEDARNRQIDEAAELAMREVEASTVTEATPLEDQAENEGVEAENCTLAKDERTRRQEELASNSPQETITTASQEYLDIRNIPEPHSANTKKILFELGAAEERQNRLEKTLKQNGIAVSEDIPYEVAKDKIAELQEQMKTLAASEEDQYIVQKKYYAMEEQMSKYFTALMLTDEYAEEQRLVESNWEESIEADNIAALRRVRSHMPVNIRNMTEEELICNSTPNGKTLPKAMAVRFKRTNVLQLIRVNPLDLERMHPSLIEGLRSTGLTLTERRALHEHLKDVGAKWQELQQDPSLERKYSWFLSLKSKFKEMVTAYDKHVQEFGPPGNHPYAKRGDPPGTGCALLGNQCPVKADAVVSYDDDYGYTTEAEFEGGMPAPSKTAAKSKSLSFSSSTKKKDDVLLASIRERIHLTDEESIVDSKLLRELFFAEKRTISLEKQLAQNGIALPKEDIPYAVAKAKVVELTEEIKVVAIKMGETVDMKLMMALEKEYSQLSDDLEKYNNSLMLTKEWAQELLEKERQWEERIRPANQEALRQIRRHMPVNIKDLSEQDLIQGFTPNGMQLPQKIVRKFKRTNILQLLRMPPSMIEPMHPSSLESMRSTGLTLTERRALHEHLKELGAKWKASSNDKMAERKWMWHESLRGKFKELVDKFDRHIEEYGPPDNHPYAKRGESGGGCPLIGKQCPVKADQEEDYSEDYGFPPEDVYNVEKVKKSNLLTVEELERRKQDDDWGYDAPVAEQEPTPAPTAGLMAAIGVRGGGNNDDSHPNTPMAGNIMSAIVSNGSQDQPKPKGPGGLLAAIQSRAVNSDKVGDSAPPVSPGKKSRMGGGLLAAIANRGRK